MNTLYGPQIYNPMFLGVSNLHLFDAVVAPTLSEGNFTRINDAIDSGAKSIFVKEGTYNEAVVADVADLKIVGENWAAIVNGGTAGHAISIAANRVQIKGLALQTTAGQGNAYDGIDIASGTFVLIEGCYFIDSDQHCIKQSTSSPTDTRIINNHLVAADFDGIQLSAVRSLVAFNVVESGVTRDGVSINGTGDNFNVIGNQIDGTILIAAGGDNGLIDGNVTNGAVTDNGTGNTIGSNEQY